MNYPAGQKGDFFSLKKRLLKHLVNGTCKVKIFRLGNFFHLWKKNFEFSNAWNEKCSMWDLHDYDLVDINSLKVKVK